MGRIEDECSIAEQAARWVVLLKGAEAAPLLPALRHWLAQSAEHEHEFKAAHAAFNALDALRELSSDVGHAWVNATASGADNVIPFPAAPLNRDSLERSSTSRRSRRSAIIVVAGLVLALLIGVLSSSRGVPESFEYATEIGEQRTIRLLDGSQLVLNTDTRVKVALAADSRSIELLQGEMLIDVGSDRRPLKVESGGVLIHDIGTRFSVRRQASATSILVEHGLVLVDYRVENRLNDRWSHLVETELEAGESVAIDAGVLSLPPVISVLSPAEVERRLSWIHGTLSFAGETVERVVAELNRYNTTHLRITDSSVKERRIGGQFRINEPVTFVRALREIGVEGVVMEESSH